MPSPPADILPASVILVADNDRDIGLMAQAIVTDAGYAASLLYERRPEAVAAAVGRLEGEPYRPACCANSSPASVARGFPSPSWTAKAAAC